MSSGNELLFGDEPDAPDELVLPERSDGLEYSVLVVDDDEYVHQLTKMVLRGFSFEGCPIRLASAMSAKEAINYLETHNNVAVALVDVVMETDNAGLDLVNHIRNTFNNNEIRLLIRTGQPGAAPEESVFQDYDVNDYLSKTELTAHKLRMAVLNALRSFRDIRKAVDLQKQIMIAEQESQEASAASEAKSQFLAHMSHEIRTPLNGIIGIADIIAQSELDPTQAKYIKTIRGSGEALLAIINDILDFSKIEAGKLELEHIDFSVNDLTNTIQELFVSQLADKKLELKFTIDEKIPKYIQGDPLRLKQILINLISNSIKFTQQGGVYVGIQLVESGPITDIQFKVRDTGIGIPQDKLNILFDAFTQVDSSTTRQYGGTGLGLQISKRLVELMQGEINAHSTEQQGSTFIFNIKVKPGKEPDELKNEAAVNQTSNHENIKILVVEDNPTNQMVVSAMLNKLGYPHDLCDDGEKAIAQTQQAQYQIILMDCQMPILDGFAATEKIRKMPQFTQVPIIALTAGATSKEQNHCFEVGMNDFLSKPITISALKNTLSKWH